MCHRTPAQGGGSGKREPGWPCPGRTRVDTELAMGLVLGLAGFTSGTIPAGF